MASSSTSQALTKRVLDSSLMPPPPPPKRIKRPAKVIDEDRYTDALSHIIARDFYPGLVEIKSKQEYLDAIDSQDHEWIAAAGRNLTEVMTPGPDGRRYRGRRGTGLTPMTGLYGRGGADTPLAWQGETPMSVMSSASTETTKSSAEPEVDTNMSLSAFQARYTSEDNESFYKLLDKQNLKKKEKYAWMWSGNKILAPRQIAHRQRESRLVSAKEGQQAADDGKQLLSIEPPDTRPAMPDAWPSNPENSLMFEPSSSLEDTSMETVQQAAEHSSRAPPKAIVHDNTRLPSVSTVTTNYHGDSPPPSPTLSAVQAALSGHPRGSSSSSTDGPSTPRVAGYAFVDSAPTPTRSDRKTRSSSWDSASLLGSGDATPNPFSIRETGRREALHFRMVDKVAKSKRNSASKKDGLLRAGATPMTAVPKFASSPRVGLGGLTPAGRKLAGRLGAGAAADGGKGSGLREFWTPRG
ncbi:hypothetical protein MMC07_005522 [Pseudocyphellaria aurata]|nr:hypothetical protein [Pseudocyphellaria aurata]